MRMRRVRAVEKESTHYSLLGTWYAVWPNSLKRSGKVNRYIIPPSQTVTTVDKN